MVSGASSVNHSTSQNGEVINKILNLVMQNQQIETRSSTPVDKALLPSAMLRSVWYLLTFRNVA